MGYRSPPCVSDARDAVVVRGVIEATRVPLAAQTTRCESASSSGTTGVQQPAPDTSRLRAVIDDISGYALADPVLPRPTATPMDPMAMPRDPTAMLGPTAALQQGDSPEATRREPPRLIFAAQRLLETLYSDQGGDAVRPVSELLRKMAIPIRMRERMVSRIAHHEGQRGPWEAQQWLDWYKFTP